MIFTKIRKLGVFIVESYSRNTGLKIRRLRAKIGRVGSSDKVALCVGEY